MSTAKTSATTVLAPPLPNNFEAERSVLGAILQNNKVLAAAAGIVSFGDFFSLLHQRIFRRMLQMAEAGSPIDIVTLSDEMQVNKEIQHDEIPQLSALPDALPRVPAVERYATIVKEKAMLRAVIHAAHAIQEKAFASNIGDVLYEAEERIDVIRERQRQGSKPNDIQEIRTYSPAELRELVKEPVEPVVYPLAVRGMLTLLDGHAKSSGKTTIGLHAVHASLSEKSFLGHATKKANVLYVTEEFQRTFLLALERTGLLKEDLAGLHILPRNEWSGVPWSLLAERIKQLCVNLKIDWLVVDTFFTICGLNRADQQNDAGLVDSAVAPLRSIAGDLDIAVQVDRHERKSGGSIGESGMGSVALTAAADIVLRLQRLLDCGPNVRELEITGRIDADVLTIELVDDRYVVRTDDVRKSTQDQVDAADEAVSANRTISVRQLSSFLSVGRFKAERLANASGWYFSGSAWERKP